MPVVICSLSDNRGKSVVIWIHGMAIGYNYHFIALVSIGSVVLVSHLPKIKKMQRANDE